MANDVITHMGSNPLSLVPDAIPRIRGVELHESLLCIERGDRSFTVLIQNELIPSPTVERVDSEPYALTHGDHQRLANSGDRSETLRQERQRISNGRSSRTAARLVRWKELKSGNAKPRDGGS